MSTPPDAFEQDLAAAVRGDVRERLKERLRGLDEVPTRQTKRNRWWWGVLLLVLLVLGYLLLRTPTSPAPHVPLGQYAYVEPYPNVVMPVLKGESAAYNPLQEAFRAYESGDYGVAAHRFRALPATDTTQFYGALSHLLNQQPFVAVRASLRTLAERPGPFQTPAGYYLGIGYGRKGERDSAVHVLERLHTQSLTPAMRRRIQQALGELKVDQ